MLKILEILKQNYGKKIRKVRDFQKKNNKILITQLPRTSDLPSPTHAPYSRSRMYALVLFLPFGD